jgi:predicted DNA-binding transcriptional regulator AlpA
MFIEYTEVLTKCLTLSEEKYEIASSIYDMVTNNTFPGNVQLNILSDRQTH